MDFNSLPIPFLSTHQDIYDDFRKVKNYLFNEYALLDENRFFDVIAQSNAKFWQTIGEQYPVLSRTNLPGYVIAQVTLERIFKEPSILKFIELTQELKSHIEYTSKLPAMHSIDIDELNLHEDFMGEVTQAFEKFNLSSLLRLDSSKNISSGLLENEDIKNMSKILSINFYSEMLDQYNNIALQHQKSIFKWKPTKISAKLKFPVLDIGSEWERQ